MEKEERLFLGIIAAEGWKVISKQTRGYWVETSDPNFNPVHCTINLITKATNRYHTFRQFFDSVPYQISEDWGDDFKKHVTYTPPGEIIETGYKLYSLSLAERSNLENLISYLNECNRDMKKYLKR